jgi:hypothetical protein
MKKLKTLFIEKQDTIVQLFLAFVFTLFIGILITVYFVAKKANPIILDQNGKPLNSQVIK